MNNSRKRAPEAISKALGIIDRSIRSGSAPGHWPGECPLREGCEHTKKNQRAKRIPCHIGMAAVLVLFLTVGLSEKVGSYGPGFIKKERTTETGAEVYKDQFTGDVVIHSDGDSTGAALTSEMAAGKLVLDSVIRWALGKGSLSVSQYLATADSIIIHQPTKGMKDALTPDLVEFASSPEAKILRAKFLSGEIPYYKDEIIEIDRVSVQFRKWEIRTPEGLVGFWVGKPIHPR